MVTLDCAKTDRHTNPTAKEYNACSTLRCSKPNLHILQKNHIHLPYNSSDYYHNGNNFMIFHQNIRGISNKTDKLIISLLPDTPHVLCLT